MVGSIITIAYATVTCLFLFALAAILFVFLINGTFQKKSTRVLVMILTLLLLIACCLLFVVDVAEICRYVISTTVTY